MRTYQLDSRKVKNVNRVFCNACGNEIKRNQYGYFNDHLHVEKVWGYHSSRDGQQYSFDICEECFQKMIDGFAVPPQETEL